MRRLGLQRLKSLDSRFRGNDIEGTGYPLRSEAEINQVAKRGPARLNMPEVTGSLLSQG